jgi:hypothetical protein
MDKKKKRTSAITKAWRIALAIIGVVAIIQELRKPSDERAWHGKVADFVPYDFRMPTIERLRSTYWNPEGSIFPGKVFGVGWALNLGALTRMVGDRGARGGSSSEPS